jgi:hypothetical protein
MPSNKKGVASIGKPLDIIRRLKEVTGAEMRATDQLITNHLGPQFTLL